MKRLGFTVIELLIVIAIMAILLTLGVVSFRNYQAHTRDKERMADIQAIQNYLESIYPQEVRAADGTLLKAAGGYPAHYSGRSGPEKLTQAQFEKIFDGLGDAAKRGPSLAAGEAFLPAYQGILAGGKSINSTADAFHYASDYENNMAAGKKGGAYIYFANNGPATNCDGRESLCRRYIILYHLETEDGGQWKVAEGKRR
ncbi:MAG: prepilin-type N-terminal cleavage/methylation domain-containing protein [Candidatus Saccharibacteria bacterium]|nr:prepilin-type N-terminal cleavage/methylation domain-containing protein [Candidatus Saccharibacteria bacterium]